MSIANEITRLQGAKAGLKTAIEGKGVTVPSSAKLDDYPDLVDSIPQGGGATLQVKNVTYTPTESAQYDTVEPDAGYDGLLEVNTEINAIPSNYVGTGVTRKTAQTYTPGTADQTIASGQYLDGAQTILGDADLVASNIKKDVNIFGVVGTYEGGGGGGYQGITVTVASTKTTMGSSFIALFNAAGCSATHTIAFVGTSLANTSEAYLIKSGAIRVTELSSSSITATGGMIRNNSSGSGSGVAYSNGSQGKITAGDTYLIVELPDWSAGGT